MWKDKLRSETFTYILYAVFIACIFLFVKGYQFNTDDQAEHLPQVYQLIDHHLYQHDYFVMEYHKTYSLRSFYVWLVYGLSFIAPVSAICFVLTMVFISLSVYSFIRITTHFTKNKFSVFLSPLFIYIVFYKYTLGGNNIECSSFICSTMSLSLAAFGLLQFLREKYYLMAMIIGIGTLFQVMDAFQPFFLIMLFMLTQYKKIGFKTILITLLIYIVFSGAMLIPMIYHQFFIHSVYDVAYFSDIIFLFRNPNHFLPSKFPMNDFTGFTILFIAGFILLVSKIKSHHRWFVVFTFWIIMLYCLLYYIGLEGMHQYWLGKTQWFKSTMWINAFCSMFIAIGLSEMIFKNSNEDKIIKYGRVLSSIGIPVLLFIILNSSMIPIAKLQGRYMIGNYKKSDLTLMHEWIATNIDKDKTILTYPSDFSFACEAKRSMPIGYKAIIHEPYFMIPWYERYKDIYGTSLENLGNKDALTVSDSLYTTVLYSPIHPPCKIDYRLDDISKCKYVDALGKTIHKEGNYLLTEFQ